MTARLGRALPVFIVMALIGLFRDPARAEERPAIADDIERGFDGFFLVTTDGGGTYRLYQRLQDAAGLDRGDVVVCLLRECLLQVAVAPEAALASWSRQGARRQPLRSRLQRVRDAYWALRGAAADQRQQATAAWRDSARGIGPCLDGSGPC